MFLPADLSHRSLGLGPGGVHDEHADRAESVGNGPYELGALPLVGDITQEGRRDTAAVLDGSDDGVGLSIVSQPVHGDSEPIAGEALCDDPPETARAPRHERHALRTSGSDHRSVTEPTRTRSPDDGSPREFSTITVTQEVADGVGEAQLPSATMTGLLTRLAARRGQRAAYSLTEAGIQVRCSCCATSCSATAATSAS